MCCSIVIKSGFAAYVISKNRITFTVSFHLWLKRSLLETSSFITMLSHNYYFACWVQAFYLKVRVPIVLTIIICLQYIKENRCGVGVKLKDKILQGAENMLPDAVQPQFPSSDRKLTCLVFSRVRPLMIKQF